MFLLLNFTKDRRLWMLHVVLREMCCSHSSKVDTFMCWQFSNLSIQKFHSFREFLFLKNLDNVEFLIFKDSSAPPNVKARVERGITLWQILCRRLRSVDFQTRREIFIIYPIRPVSEREYRMRMKKCELFVTQSLSILKKVFRIRSARIVTWSQTASAFVFKA